MTACVYISGTNAALKHLNLKVRRGILALLAGDVSLSFNRYWMDGCVTLLVSEFYPEGWMGVNIFSFFLVSGSVPLLLHSLYGSASEHGELTLASSPSIQS